MEFLEEHFCDVELANLKALKVLKLKHSTESEFFTVTLNSTHFYLKQTTLLMEQYWVSV